MTTQPATFGRPYPRHAAWRQGLLTKTHTLVYRLSSGRLGTTLLGMPMLLLTTWGRRTDKLRTTPLLYLPVNDVFVLVASNGGALHHPTWWFNLQAHPEALVQIGPPADGSARWAHRPPSAAGSGPCSCKSTLPMRAIRPARIVKFR